MISLKRLVSCVAVAAACLQAVPTAAQSITVAGDHFVVTWPDELPKAKFLLFMSYFDGIRASPSMRDDDLYYIANVLHFDGIRVLPNWQQRSETYCAVDTDDRLMNRFGTVNAGALGRLKALIEKAAEYKLIVNVTFTRETYGDDDPSQWIPVSAYQTAIGIVADELNDYDNVIFDLQNEFNNNKEISDIEAEGIREA